MSQLYFIPFIVIIQNCPVKINAFKCASMFLYECENTCPRFILACVIASVAVSASLLHKVLIMEYVYSIEFFTTE